MVCYQYYFLFFNYRWLEGQHITEPHHLAKLTQGKKIYTQKNNPHISCALYQDKRLFRITEYHDKKLSDEVLGQQIFNHRKALNHYYDECEIQPHSEKSEVTIKYKNGSDYLLYAIGIVIADKQFANIDDPIITLPIEINGKSEKAEFIATENELLFRLEKGNEKENKQRFYFANFELNTNKLPTASRYTAQWQITFLDSKRNITLSPLKKEENEYHPILHIYGLTWKNSLSETNAPPHELENLFLTGMCNNKFVDKTVKEHEPTFLTDIMPYLLMTRWQFAHIFLVSDNINSYLNEKNTSYRHIEDDTLKMQSLDELRDTLQEMNSLEAATQYELSRIEKAIKTIDNNKNKLAYFLLKYHKKLKKQGWFPHWQWRINNLQSLINNEDVKTVPSLLEKARFASKELQNKQGYIEASLKHLQGSKLRWSNLISRKEHQTQERLNVLVNVLLILGTVITLLQIELENPYLKISVSFLIITLVLKATFSYKSLHQFLHKLFKE